MGNAISACFSKYATFSGRATRSEFWYFYLFYGILYIVGAIAESATGMNGLMYIFVVPLWLPLLAAEVRRMHDVGKSGWFLLIPIYNLILLCTASTEDNKYGPRA